MTTEKEEQTGTSPFKASTLQNLHCCWFCLAYFTCLITLGCRWGHLLMIWLSVSTSVSWKSDPVHSLMSLQFFQPPFLLPLTVPCRMPLLLGQWTSMTWPYHLSLCLLIADRRFLSPNVLADYIVLLRYVGDMVCVWVAYLSTLTHKLWDSWFCIKYHGLVTKVWQLTHIFIFVSNENYEKKSTFCEN